MHNELTSFYKVESRMDLSFLIEKRCIVKQMLARCACQLVMGWLWIEIDVLLM